MAESPSNLENLPADVIRSIINLLDDDIALANMCSVNKNLHKNICNESFWRNKIINKFHLTSEDIKKYFDGKSLWNYYIFLTKQSKRNPDELLHSGSSLGRGDLVKVALEMGTDLNTRSLALLSVAYRGQIEIVRLLLHYGTSPGSLSSALINASMAGHTEIAKLLLDNGASIRGDTLILASKKGNTEAVRLLLEYGADPHTNNNEALALARQKGYTKIVNLLERQ